MSQYIIGRRRLRRRFASCRGGEKLWRSSSWKVDRDVADVAVAAAVASAAASGVVIVILPSGGLVVAVVELFM